MATPTATGRLRDTSVPANDRTYAMWVHLSPLLAFVVLGPFAGVAPLILWLARRDASHFADDHGREVVNMSITGTLLFFLGVITAGIMILAWIIWAIPAVIGIVRGATAANNGEYFRYPMTIRFIS